MARPDRIHFDGRILFLTEDLELLKKQLEGEDLAFDPDRKLIDAISTDEITPGWVCFYYDETLGRYSMVGLRGGLFEKDTLKKGGFSVIVSGESKGCGSSRETAPYSEKTAGIELVIAESIEKIYGQNCQNIGLLTSTDFSLIPRILRGEEIELSTFTEGLDPISAEIVRSGGLFEYNKRRMAGETSPPPIETPARPMTMVEKIIAKHAVRDAKTGALGVPAVAPGDALFVRTDVRFSHEYVTPMADSLFRQGFGPEATVTDHDTRLHLPRPSHLSRRRDGGVEAEDGPPRARRRSRHHAGKLLEEARPQALRRGQRRRLRGHLPQRGGRGSRHSPAWWWPAPTATPAWPACSAASPSASAAPTWRTAGTRRTSA